jgi:hypothetical protein
MRARSLLLALCLCACSIVVGEEPLSVSQVPGPAATPLVLEGTGRLRDARLLLADDGAPWLALPQTYPTYQGEILVGLNISRLRAPFHIQKLFISGVVYPSTGIAPGPGLVQPARAFCVVEPPMTEDKGLSRVSMRQPGDPEPHSVTIAPKPVVLCGQRTMVAFSMSRGNKSFELLRRDAQGKITRKTLPWPVDANPEWEQGPRGFDENEEVLVLVDAEYRTHLRYLDSGEDHDLGVIFWGEGALGTFVYIDIDGVVHAFSIPERRGRALGYRLSSEGNIVGLDATRESILTCDWDGLRSLSLRPRRPGPSESRVLDAEPCIAPGSTLARRSGWIQYEGRGTRSVPLDGSAPARTIWSNVEGAQLLATCSDGTVAYSLDPKERYGVGVGDGWIGRWRFMERGRDARFSLATGGCSRIRFKEHSANLRRLGELRSVSLADRSSRFLARNVGFYAELPDGRLLVADDLAVIGSHNRLVVIDEDRGTSRTLLSGPTAVTASLPLASVLPPEAAQGEVLLEVDTPELRGPRRIILVKVPPP